MVTIEDKLALFQKTVLHDAERAYQIEKSQWENRAKKELENHEKKANQQADAYIEKVRAKAASQAKQMVSGAQRNSRSKVLSLRQELIESLIEAVTDRIHHFVDSEIYALFLKDSIKSALEAVREFSEVTVEMTSKDITRFGEMIVDSLKEDHYRAKQIKLVPSKKDLIGGFVLYNALRTIRVDFSIATLVGENRSFVGRLVYEIIDEAGRENDER